MYALDTNTLIYFFKGMGNVAQRLLAVPPASIAIPTIVLYEIETGIAKSGNPERRRAQLGTLLEVVSLLPFDAAAARQAALIRTELENAGSPIGPLDILIAGTARAHHAVLVTCNTREFSRVAGLGLEDWFG